MYKPASVLQAMTYAIGGCLSLKSAQASKGASWIITSYKGTPGRSGKITEFACDLFSRVGQAYSQLLKFGADNQKMDGLPGPGPGKCSSCEYAYGCNYRVEANKSGGKSFEEPVWLKYARRKGNKYDN